MSTIVIEIEDSENIFGQDLTFEVEVKYGVTPYYGGSREDPPEGGEVEIDSFDWWIKSEDGKDKNLLFSFFSKEKIEEIQGWIEDKINNDSSILQNLEENAKDYNDYEPDEYDRCDY